MQVVDTIAALRSARQGVRGSVGLVPTMGALHAGHIALVEVARQQNETVLATIFVNPKQFGPSEDLAAYPRTLERDLKMLEDAGVDVVFTPTTDLMYPAGYQTYIEVEEVAKGLEGAHRPGHFRGVATVVAKLFNLSQADRAYFGQKDAQQVAVIRQMARDLNFPGEIVVCPTIREADGLALSSRNVYLNPEQRGAAGVLYRALRAAAERYAHGEREPQRLRAIMEQTLKAVPIAQTEYVAVSDPRTMREIETRTDSPLLLSMAVKIGPARLIDNMLLPAHLNTLEHLSHVLGVAEFTDF